MEFLNILSTAGEIQMHTHRNYRRRINQLKEFLFFKKKNFISGVGKTILCTFLLFWHMFTICNSAVVYILQNIFSITFCSLYCLGLKKKNKAGYIYAKKLRALYDAWHALHIKLLH